MLDFSKVTREPATQMEKVLMETVALLLPNVSNMAPAVFSQIDSMLRDHHPGYISVFEVRSARLKRLAGRLSDSVLM
jgi:hypothetical protein